MKYCELCGGLCGFSLPVAIKPHKRIKPSRIRTSKESEMPCRRLAETGMCCSVLDRCGPTALTSHLLSWVFLLSWMFQFSASSSAQWAMVMATGQKRSSPGGPYVTSGPRRISQPSSVWKLNAAWHTEESRRHKERKELGWCRENVLTSCDVTQLDRLYWSIHGAFGCYTVAKKRWLDYYGSIILKIQNMQVKGSSYVQTFHFKIKNFVMCSKAFKKVLFFSVIVQNSEYANLRVKLYTEILPIMFAAFYVASKV